MRILETFAVEAEFAPWRAIRRFQKVKINEKHSSGGADVLQTSIGENVVWVLLTGMGIKLFDHQTACCLRDAGLDVIVSSGLVGALNWRCFGSEIDRGFAGCRHRFNRRYSLRVCRG
jgi:hypothetical protein